MMHKVDAMAAGVRSLIALSVVLNMAVQPFICSCLQGKERVGRKPRAKHRGLFPMGSGKHPSWAVWSARLCKQYSCCSISGLAQAKAQPLLVG